MGKRLTAVCKKTGLLLGIFALVIVSIGLQSPEPLSAACGGSEFTLTVNVSTIEGGKVKVDDFIPIEYPDISTVAKGAFVTLEALPQEGYTFLGWSGSISSEENPVTLEVDCTKNILANF